MSEERRDERVSVRLDRDLDEWVRAEAERRGWTVSDLVRHALAEAGVIPTRPQE